MAKFYWIIATIITLILGAAWIWISSIYFTGGTNGYIPSPKEGFLAPDFELKNISGDSFQLSAFQGNVVLVNIWASWCSPCQQEMPAMQRVFEDYQDQGFIILAVNATHQDTQTQAQAFANELGLKFPILFDMDGNVTRQYLVNAFPSSFFIDKEGIIREVVVGGPMSEALLKTRIENLLDLGE